MWDGGGGGEGVTNILELEFTVVVKMRCKIHLSHSEVGTMFPPHRGVRACSKYPSDGHMDGFHASCCKFGTDWNWTRYVQNSGKMLSAKLTKRSGRQTEQIGGGNFKGMCTYVLTLSS